MSIELYRGQKLLGTFEVWESWVHLAREIKRDQSRSHRNSFAAFFAAIAKDPPSEQAFYQTVKKVWSKNDITHNPSTCINQSFIEEKATDPLMTCAVRQEIDLIFLKNMVRLLDLHQENGEFEHYQKAKKLYDNLSRRHQIGIQTQLNKMGGVSLLDRPSVEGYLVSGIWCSSHLEIEGREVYPHYHYLPGRGDEKKDNDISHKIMTLNACMMDGDLPQRFGGMIRAKERLTRFAQLIKEHDPDIYLGQEVTLKKGCALFKELQHTYAHFWAGIGAAPGSQLSALFVASKYPIVSQPLFFAFPKELQRFGKSEDLERGFICVETPRYWIVCSHLEAGSPEGSKDYRRQQLRYITEKMDQIVCETRKPYIVTGDLNIERTAKPDDEYSQSGIDEDYFDLYTQQHPTFDEETMTCTNLFTSRANGKEEPVEEEERNEIDDYVLVRKGCEEKFADLDVQLVKSTFDLNKSWRQAITDHRAYVATFSL